MMAFANEKLASQSVIPGVRVIATFVVVAVVVVIVFEDYDYLVH